MAFYHGMETTAWPTIATEKVRSTHLLACGQSLCSMQVQQDGKRVKAEGCGSGGGSDLSMKLLRAWPLCRWGIHQAVAAGEATASVSAPHRLSSSSMALITSDCIDGPQSPQAVAAGEATVSASLPHGLYPAVAKVSPRPYRRSPYGESLL